jgi:hypothetical protein
VLGEDLRAAIEIDRIRKFPENVADLLRGVAEPPQEVFDLGMGDQSSLSNLHGWMLPPGGLSNRASSGSQRSFRQALAHQYLTRRPGKAWEPVASGLLDMAIRRINRMTPRRLKVRREERRRELRAAQILGAEMTLVIGTLDMALKRSNAKWLPSLAENRALTTAWQNHWDSLELGRGLGHWKVLQDAVDAVSPVHTLGLAGGYYPELRRVLTQRRERLIDAAQVLQVVIDSCRASRAMKLRLLAEQRERKWTSRYDLREHGPVARPSARAATPILPLRPCPPVDS